jgi:glutathione S-transferase
LREYAIDRKEITMTRIIYGAAPSPFARKVRIVLHEKGLDYEMKNLIPFPKTPELLALNPLGKIPIYEEGDFRIPDSSVICAYLERVQPEPRIYPRDPKEFARALFYEEYADTKMIETIGPLFFQRFVQPNIFKQEPDPAIIDDAIQNQIPPVFDWLEARVTAGRPTLLEEFTIADVAVGAQLQALSFANHSIDTDRWPKLAGYFEGVNSRPSFEKAMG